MKANQNFFQNSRCPKPSKIPNLISEMPSSQLVTGTKATSPKPTGGLMAQKTSYATQKPYRRNGSKNGHLEHQNTPK